MMLITGAGSGLGAALARRYAKEQPLCISGRNPAKLEAVARDIAGNVQISVADLCEPYSVEALFDSLPQTPDTIIHSAGSGYFGPLQTQSPEAIKALLDNNVTSAILLLREALKRYRDQAMTVVIVMSTAAQVAKAGESTYCAAKWAVRGLVESVRLELKGSPMRVIAVYPGGMDTDFWATSGKAVDTSSFMSADEAAGMLKQALVGTEHGFVSDISINRG